MFVSLSDSLIQCLYKNEKKANLVHEVAMSVCFGHKLAIVNSGSPSSPTQAFWSLVCIRGILFFYELPPKFLFLLTCWSLVNCFFLPCIRWTNAIVCLYQ
jgi:hypothetical protein